MSTGFYCFCVVDVFNSSPVNDFLNNKVKDLVIDYPIQERVVLKTKMKCIKTGAQQFFEETGFKENNYKRNYPDVDVFKCPKCGHIIVRE